MQIDLGFLAFFLVFFTLFLYKHRKNLKREGLMFLYRTNWGVKLIDRVGKKYKKTLKALSYVSIVVGYLLTIGVLYLVYTIVKIYLFNPLVVRTIGIPPITPIFPYINKVIPGLGLPNLYFTSFIIAIAAIMIPHEFFHGIFMRRYNIKIKTTGFAFFPWFFPIFPAAFVEQDDKSMEKATNFHQMAALSAGTFANVLTAIIVFLILWGFFAAAFAPAGVTFDSYATTPINVAGITSVNGTLVQNATSNYTKIVSVLNSKGEANLTYNGQNYIATKSMLESQEGNNGTIIVYDSAPAINAKLEGTITRFNGVKVLSINALSAQILRYSPGQTVNITTETTNGSVTRNIVLGSRPDNPSLAWLGVGFYNNNGENLVGKMESALSFKTPHVYYTSEIGNFGIFIYNLLWWVVLICVSVAFINMLPMGIFDGGRFFYLTVLSITKNEKFSQRAFKLSTWFFLFLLLLLMIAWALAFL